MTFGICLDTNTVILETKEDVDLLTEIAAASADGGAISLEVLAKGVAMALCAGADREFDDEADWSLGATTEEVCAYLLDHISGEVGVTQISTGNLVNA